jgi:uncharacterized protein (TIGR02611 family)
MRRTRGGRLTWKVAVAAVGVAVILAGVVMLVAPGPGWATIVLGLAILSTEFAWAARVRHRIVVFFTRAGRMILRQPAWLRTVTYGALAIALLTVGYLAFALAGVPDWVPQGVRDEVRSWPLVRG